MTDYNPPAEKERPMPIIAPRMNEDDEEQRFREAMERLGGQMMATLDAAIQMRTAAEVTQRSRHLVRGELGAAMFRAMNTIHLHRFAGQGKPKKQRRP